MKLTPEEITALTAAHDSDERCRIINSATQFVLDTTTHRPTGVEGLAKWMRRAQAHLDALLRDKSIAKDAPALIARYRTEIPIAEANHQRAIEVAAKAKATAKPTTETAPEIAKPAPAPVVAAKSVAAPTSTAVKPSVATPAIHAPVIATPPPALAQAVSSKPLHAAKQMILDRQAQIELKRFDETISAIHAALRRYRLQAETEAHTRHKFEMRARIAALEVRLIETIKAKSLAREAALNSLKP